MTRKFLQLSALSIVSALAGALAVLLPKQTGLAPHRVSAPTLARVRDLGELATLRARISDVQVTTIEGYTGGVQCVLVIRGIAEMGTDLEDAAFTKLDQAERTAELRLAPVNVRLAKLDHEHTKVYRIDRTGLWRIVPGSAGETKLVNRAMRRAEQTVRQTVKKKRLRRRARGRAERVLRHFFKAIGWRVRVRWAP